MKKKKIHIDKLIKFQAIFRSPPDLSIFDSHLSPIETGSRYIKQVAHWTKWISCSQLQNVLTLQKQRV